MRVEIFKWTRLRCSVAANPRYELHTDDGVFITQSDAAIVYDVENYEYPALFDIAFTMARRVYAMTPVTEDR